MLHTKRHLAAAGVIAFAFTACESGDVPRGRLVEATILTCEPIDDLLEERLEFWPSELDRIRETAIVHDDWASQVPEMVREHPGVLLTVRVSDSAWVYSHRWFGEPKRITIGDWEAKNETERVFSNEFGATCTGYPIGSSSSYLLGAMGQDRRPPTHLADFLGVDALVRPPQVFYEHLPREWRLARHRGNDCDKCP